MTAEAPEHDAPASKGATYAVEPWRSFATWACDHLQLELNESSDGFRVLSTADEPASESKPASGSGIWRLSLRRRRQREAVSETPAVDYRADSPAELVDFLLAQLSELDAKPSIAPADQPAATHEIADRLLNAYQVDKGKLHMAGCRLETTRYARHSARAESADGPVVKHWFTTEAGESVDAERYETLGLGGPMADADPVAPGGAATGRPANNPSNAAPLLSAQTNDDVTAQVLLKRATGVLQATIDGSDLSIPFDGWARVLTPPPATCPETGVETFHLTAIDDGRVVAAESTGVCDATGRRLLRSELRTCSVSGRRLAAELCTDCPVTGEPVHKELLVTCPKCHQPVSQLAAGPNDCRGCRPRQPVPSDSPQRARLLAIVPALKHWRRWRVSETQSAEMIEATRWWRRLLVVIDRESGSVVHAATKPRLGGTWKPMPVEELK